MDWPTEAAPGDDTPPAGWIAEVLRTAVAFASEAGEVVRTHFGGVIDAELKADGSPVTVADREVESLLRRRITARWPEHGILGEEMGTLREGAEVRWLLDPIDGTRSFLRGVPLHGVLIGVESASAGPLVGVAHFPALGEMVAAGHGLGCRWNGRPCRVSEVASLDRALLLTTDQKRMMAAPEAAGFRQLEDEAVLVRSWGDCYGHILVATGRAEVMIDPELSPWDAAPLLTILTEAGGRFTNLDGAPTIHGGSGVSTNGRLHDRVLSALRPPAS